MGTNGRRLPVVTADFVLCKVCDKPIARVLIGGTWAFGHVVTRRNGDKHPAVAAPTTAAKATPPGRLLPPLPASRRLAGTRK